jgi:hypothetical protein
MVSVTVFFSAVVAWFLSVRFYIDFSFVMEVNMQILANVTIVAAVLWGLVG